MYVLGGEEKLGLNAGSASLETLKLHENHSWKKSVDMLERRIAPAAAYLNGM